MSYPCGGQYMARNGCTRQARERDQFDGYRPWDHIAKTPRDRVARSRVWTPDRQDAFLPTKILERALISNAPSHYRNPRKRPATGLLDPAIFLPNQQKHQTCDLP